MRRREFIAGLGGAAWPLAVRAQEGDRVRRVGVLTPWSEDDPFAQNGLRALVQRLAEMGWSKGHNLRIELRWAGGDLERVRLNAKELVSIVFIAGTAPANAAALSELALPWPWALPFVGLLLSIAVSPLVEPKFWQAHYGKIAFMWSVLAMTPLAALYGIPTALTALAHATLGEYLSFIILLTALYVVAGSTLVTGSLRGTPLVNAAILALGTVDGLTD